ncbi:Uncharacterised protein [Vibrio cholerae]|nr:Uncharacterised protein [Vibrio cholerae]
MAALFRTQYKSSLVARANRFARVTEWFPVINLVEKVGQ